MRSTLSAAICVASGTLIAISDASAAETGQKTNARIEWFYGAIDKTSVQAFLTKMAGKKIERLGINSQGGDVDAALDLANWVKEHNLDVQVSAFCMSSCANYIFTAGKNKYINSDALIIWHGSIEQKNFRESQTSYEALAEKSRQDETSLSDEERNYLEERRGKYLALAALRVKQATFFKSIQVDESITRLGQEPVKYPSGNWTASLAVMQKFGITNVHADVNYGQPDYIQASKFKIIAFRRGVLTFDLNEQGELVALSD